MTTSQAAPPARPLRLLTAGASDHVACHYLYERTRKDADTDDVLDASAMRVEPAERLASGERYDSVVAAGRASTGRAVLGYAALDVVRNYCGADDAAGNEIVAASQLGGRVCLWVRLDPELVARGATMADEAASTTISDDGEDIRYVRPHAEFDADAATGTALAVRPPGLANHYSKRERDVLVALGRPDGAVMLCRTGILAARPGGDGTASKNAVVGDSSSSAAESVTILSGSPPGEVVAAVGGGHACVMSLAFHPTIPNAFVVGRKDGTVDVYSSPMSDDYYYSGDLKFRRMHRLARSHLPVRALSFSADGALLLAGDDGGRLYSHDASCNTVKTNMSAPVKLVACAVDAHRGWIMDLAALPDGRRAVTCGSDRSVRVWDCGTGLASSAPVHAFEGAHEGIVWGVCCGSSKGGETGTGRAADGKGERILAASCGDDGAVQVFSCGE